ncbi:MAG TPA: hypothetical protein VML75_05025 [Kofleriaceae bacterium]|nr:hypothetical protein [Kofleriaceae bacterium]
MGEKEPTDAKKAERAARERFERAATELREGSYRFSSKVRGQAALILEELIDPDGDAVATLAEVEGDAGALALALPLDLITFETWLFGQVGDQDELDLKMEAHWELWFNLGAWIGETMRRRHGGHWLIVGDDPKSWRLGFSKILLEIAPHNFAEQLLRMGQGAGRRMVAELERLRQMHVDQAERDGGEELDRFTSQHYVRMHTIPLGQFMVLDFPLLSQMWNKAPASELIKETRKQAKRLDAGNQPIVEKVIQALEQADLNKPIAQQTGDRGLFEAVAQIVGLRRATAPVAMDVLESMVIPAMHVGIPDKFPPLDDEDLQMMRKGAELFVVFLEVVPHKYPADDEGFLGAIPHESLSTPYADKSNLEVGKGDWVIIDPKHFKGMLLEFDSKRLLEKYDEFVAFLRSDPRAPRRRDNGRMLAETVARTLADLKASVVAASKDKLSLVFRMLPPPG